MGEGEPPRARGLGHFGGFARRAVSGLYRTGHFVVGEGGFVHEQVGVARRLNGVGTGARIAGNDHAPPASPLAHEYPGIDHAPVVEGDLLAPVNAPPQRPFGDAKLPGQVGVEAAFPFLLDQGVAERGGRSMLHGEGVDPVLAAGQRGTGIELGDVHGKRGAFATKTDALTQHSSRAAGGPKP